jgi:hypothetical protein
VSNYSIRLLLFHSQSATSDESHFCSTIHTACLAKLFICDCHLSHLLSYMVSYTYFFLQCFLITTNFYGTHFLVLSSHSRQLESSSDIIFITMSAPHVKIVPLLDVHQLLMLLAGTLTYSVPGTFSSNVFCNVLQLLVLLNNNNYYYYYYYYL